MESGGLRLSGDGVEGLKIERRWSRGVEHHEGVEWKG